MSFPTIFTVPGLPDGQCWARPCMHPGEDKGTFVQGRGYMSYYAKPRPVCSTNFYHGCPFPLPEPEPENARCCFRPDYRRKGTAPANHRECSTCGAHSPVKVAHLLNALPTQPGVPCKHEGPSDPVLLVGWFECSKCRGFWDHCPKPFETPQYTFDEYLDELKSRLARVRPPES